MKYLAFLFAVIVCVTFVASDAMAQCGSGGSCGVPSVSSQVVSPTNQQVLAQLQQLNSNQGAAAAAATPGSAATSAVSGLPPISVAPPRNEMNELLSELRAQNALLRDQLIRQQTAPVQYVVPQYAPAPVGGGGAAASSATGGGAAAASSAAPSLTTVIPTIPVKSSSCSSSSCSSSGSIFDFLPGRRVRSKSVSFSRTVQR